MSDLNAIADVLEKTANFLDCVEEEKQAAVRAEREKLLTAMCTKYAEATGEEVSPEMRSKLANADSDVISVIEKLAVTTSSDELGSPSDKKDSAGPQTIKEASVAADERYLDWVLS